ncbi:hypothetical protein MTO96_044053 [Rhipicephalus appendiculatus]
MESEQPTLLRQDEADAIEPRHRPSRFKQRRPRIGVVEMEPSDFEPGSCQGPKTALNALLTLRFNKLQCKPGRTRDLWDSKAGSIAVSQLPLTHPENSLNARLPSRSTKVQRKPAPTRKTVEHRQRLNLPMVGEVHEVRAGRIPDSALNLTPSQSGLTPTPLEQQCGERFDIATEHLNPHGRYDTGSQASPHIGLHRREQEPVLPTEMDAMTKYLVRPDLVSSVLVQFNDRPENYRSWRSTFQGVTRSLDLNTNEELDLLVKWLGVESSVYTKRLRSVHVANPEAGLCLIWERLEECYGRPEVIEDALFKRIANFPRLSDKDTHRLRELGDLLLELECAKADPHLTWLSYINTARGTSPIVEKLPPCLQEAWIAKGSRHKQDRGVAFPPFAFFAEFIRGQAKMRNDPSCTLSSAIGAVSKHEGNRKAPISVYVTDVELSSETSPRGPQEDDELDQILPFAKEAAPFTKGSSI